jgi:hypothetical protein
MVNTSDLKEQLIRCIEDMDESEMYALLEKLDPENWIFEEIAREADEESNLQSAFYNSTRGC